MKRILLILMIFISVNSIAQITQKNGNVGISKAIPQYKLDVNGSLNCTSFYLNGVQGGLSQWTTSGNNIYFNTGNIGMGYSYDYSKVSILQSENYMIFDPAPVDYYALKIWSNMGNETNDPLDLGNTYGLYINCDNTVINNGPLKTIGLYSYVHGATYNYSAILMGGNVGINTESPTKKLDVTGTARFGDGANYTSTESDGTLVFTGDATVYKDAIVNFIYKGGTGEATLDTYVGGVKQLKFLVNDLVNLSNTEAPHDWDEETAIEMHLHWMVKNALIAGDKVRWQLEYSVSNIVANSNTNTIFCDPSNPTVFGTRTVIVEYTAPIGGIPAGTHLYTTFETVTPTNFKIGAGFIGTLTRIAKTAGGTDPTTGSIFASNVGIHYKVNTIGSRTTSAK